MNTNTSTEQDALKWRKGTDRGWRPGDPAWMLYTKGREFTGAYRRARKTGSIALYSVEVIPPEDPADVRAREGFRRYTGGYRHVDPMALERFWETRRAKPVAVPDVPAFSESHQRIESRNT